MKGHSDDIFSTVRRKLTGNKTYLTQLHLRVWGLIGVAWSMGSDHFGRDEREEWKQMQYQGGEGDQASTGPFCLSAELSSIHLDSPSPPDQEATGAAAKGRTRSKNETLQLPKLEQRMELPPVRQASQKLCLSADLARDDGLQPPLSPSSSAPSFPPSQRACVGSSAPQTACNTLLRDRGAVGRHADQSRIGSRCIRLSLHCNLRQYSVLLDSADLGPDQKVSLTKDPAPGRWFMPPSRQLVPVGHVWRWSALTSAATRPAFTRDPYSFPTPPKTAGRARLAMRLSQMLGLFDDLCLAQSELTSDTTLTTTAPDSLGHFRRVTHLPAPLRRYSFRDLHIFPHSARPADGKVQTLPMALAPQQACIVCNRHSWREIGNDRARRKFKPGYAGTERLGRGIFHLNLSRRTAQPRIQLDKTERAVLLYSFCPKPN
ncbi:unnamed protein product [Blumeria hordei]|uniref:Uncharacterized protein n=1 Tax=Blumeria hordei TaxID=2867405 RepID=A0A383ULF6_BLUHO|nr:unnamed protein product [Blumeria hordei]